MPHVFASFLPYFNLTPKVGVNWCKIVSKPLILLGLWAITLKDIYTYIEIRSRKNLTVNTNKKW